MKKLLFYLHLISALFLIGRELVLFSGYRGILTLGFLVYLVLIIVPEILPWERISNLFLVLPVIGILLFYPQVLLYIIPFHIGRILLNINGRRDYYLYLLFIVPVFFIDRENLFTYLLIASVTAIINIFIHLYNLKMEKIKRKLDRLEGDNNRLSRRLSASKQLDIHKEYLLKLEERSKIAQRLHDELGHTISGSIFQLEAASLIIDDDIERAKRMIGSVSTVLNDGIDSIRKSLRVIKPKSGDLGVEEIRAILLDFKKLNSIEYRVDIKGDISTIKSRIWLIIISNLKESLTNTLKYSGATRVDFSVEVLNKLIRVKISDNGEGCKTIKEGMGLNGMEERTSSVDGTLIVDGSHGFSIIMLFKRG